MKLSKQQVIMHRSQAINSDPSHEFFWERLDGSGHPRVVSLSRADFADMGRPEVITVTIEPGDLLNDDAS